MFLSRGHFRGNLTIPYPSPFQSHTPGPRSLPHVPFRGQIPPFPQHNGTDIAPVSTSANNTKSLAKVWAFQTYHVFLQNQLIKNITMAILTLQVDNNTVLNNLKSILKLIKGVTIVPPAQSNTISKPASKTKDISGIGGAWASDDFPTPEDIYTMRKTSHKILGI